MKCLLKRTTLTVVVVGISILLGVSNAAWAQDAVEKGAATLSEGKLKTLDDLRRLRARDDFIRDDFIREVPVHNADLSESAKPVSEKVRLEKTLIPAEIKKVAMDAIRAQQRKLSEPGVNRADAEQSLQAALTEYFILDMLQRVKELDEIKAKVAETEAKLQKRLESQKEAIDLQMQIMIREADGLGFFSTGNSPGIPSLSPDVSIKGKTDEILVFPMPQ